MLNKLLILCFLTLNLSIGHAIEQSHISNFLSTQDSSNIIQGTVQRTVGEIESCDAQVDAILDEYEESISYEAKCSEQKPRSIMLPSTARLKTQ